MTTYAPVDSLSTTLRHPASGSAIRVCCPFRARRLALSLQNKLKSTEPDFWFVLIPPPPPTPYKCLPHSHSRSASLPTTARQSLLRSLPPSRPLPSTPPLPQTTLTTSSSLPPAQTLPSPVSTRISLPRRASPLLCHRLARVLCFLHRVRRARVVRRRHTHSPPHPRSLQTQRAPGRPRPPLPVEGVYLSPISRPCADSSRRI